MWESIRVYMPDGKLQVCVQIEQQVGVVSGVQKTGCFNGLLESGLQGE